MNQKPQAQWFMHINITLLHSYNSSMRKDSVAFDLNRSSSEVLGRMHSNYFHACREHQNTCTCFQQDGISSSIFLFRNSGRLAACFPAPTYSLYPPFPSIPGRPPLMKSCGMSESLSVCVCRYTIPFTLEGVVSMYTIPTVSFFTTKIFTACSSYLLWPSYITMFFVCDIFLERMF